MASDPVVPAPPERPERPEPPQRPERPQRSEPPQRPEPPQRSEPPARPETLRSRLTRFGFNLFPAYRGTGARITYLDPEWREVRVRIPLSWRTRNYVGTIFGGSMYGGVDPVYMLMLIKRLGPGYTVWDKAASIRFRRPGRGTLHARFVVDDDELAAIRAALADSPATERSYTVELEDEWGEVHAVVEKLIHIRRNVPRGED